MQRERIPNPELVQEVIIEITSKYRNITHFRLLVKQVVTY